MMSCGPEIAPPVPRVPTVQAYLNMEKGVCSAARRVLCEPVTVATETTSHVLNNT